MRRFGVMLARGMLLGAALLGVALTRFSLTGVSLLGVFLTGVALTGAPAAWAGPSSFNLGLDVPAVVVDSKAPPDCSAAWLVGNTATNDFYVARAVIAHGKDDKPVQGHMPCPPIQPQVAARALDTCAARALDRRQCVYADMSRGFETAPRLDNTAENASRCTSDQAKFIGMACWMAKGLAVCNAACGETASEAEAKAGARCEDKQRHPCPIRESAPVAMP